jgi:hypothetical protein
MRWFFEWVTIEGIILVSLGLAFVVTVLIIGLFAYYRSKYTYSELREKRRERLEQIDRESGIESYKSDGWWNNWGVRGFHVSGAGGGKRKILRGIKTGRW